MEHITANRLAAGSVLRFAYLAHLALVFPICLLFGLIGMMSGGTVYHNGQTVHGLPALFIALALGAILPLLPALWFWLGVLVLRLLRGRGPGLSVRQD